MWNVPKDAYVQVAVGRLVSRDAAPVLAQLVVEEPAILVEGPRGSGKSTLLREIAVARGARVVDLDDEAVLGFVQQDPTSALDSPGLVFVDEFQRAPAVLSVVKRVVDADPTPRDCASCVIGSATASPSASCSTPEP